MCFTAPTALSGAFTQLRRRLGEKQKLRICFDFCTRDRRKFNTLLHDRRSVSHICCLSYSFRKNFCAPHVPQTLRTTLFTLKSRHFAPPRRLRRPFFPLALLRFARCPSVCGVRRCACQIDLPRSATCLAARLRRRRYRRQNLRALAQAAIGQSPPLARVYLRSHRHCNIVLLSVFLLS